jgi:hypothetical protein
MRILLLIVILFDQSVKAEDNFKSNFMKKCMERVIKPKNGIFIGDSFSKNQKYYKQLSKCEELYKYNIQIKHSPKISTKTEK